MENKVRRYIQESRLLEAGDKLIVAVSGGADSVALWHVLSALRPRLNLQLHLAHLNHLLRGGEAAADAEFARRLAEESNCPYSIEAVAVADYAQEQKISLQDAARKLRYQFLRRLAREQGAAKIALGHNADDQAETVLMRLLRGSGPEGLCAIPPRRDKIIRPLLCCTRREILHFLQERQLPYREDSSNQKDIYLRNRVRRRLLPLLLEEYNPRLKRQLNQLAHILRDEESFWRRHILPQWWEKALLAQDQERVVLDAALLRQLPPALQRRLCRKAIACLKGDLQAINYSHIHQILYALRAKKGEKHFCLPNHLKIITYYDKLIIRRQPKGQDLAAMERKKAGRAGERADSGGKEAVPGLALNIPGVTRLDEFGLSVRAELLSGGGRRWQDDCRQAWLDWEKVKQPLLVRRRRPGDIFTPLGMQQGKKLKDFFIDSKTPRSQRDEIPLLTGGGEIIWVMGMRISEKAKITPRTKQILHLRLS